jgi:hypothetical protein
MLLRTSRAGPPPAGGSEPVIAMSCSSTSQRSYPTARGADDLVDPRVPSPSGRNSPACDGLRRAAARRCGPAAPARVDVLEVDVADRGRVVADERAGSTPPISRWPVSKHQRTSVCASAARRRAPSRRACRRAGAGRARGPRGDEVGELAQVLAGALPAVVVERGGRRPVEVGDQRGDEHVGAGVGELAGRARGLAARAAVGLVHDERHEAADERRPWRSSAAAPARRRAAASPAAQLGRLEPSSPSPRARARRQLQAPAGTSQTPHEIGAAASRAPTEGRVGTAFQDRSLSSAGPLQIGALQWRAQYRDGATLCQGDD